MKNSVFGYLLLLFLYPLITYSQQTIGLFLNTPNSYEGYTLFSPTSYNQSFLINNCGKLVHVWNGTHNTGLATYLLNDGNLIRTGLVAGSNFSIGGKGGMIEIIDWNDSILWTYQHSTSTYCLHHDICVLPNGNILAISWEKKTNTVAINNGRNPSLLNGDMWAEKIIEIQPIYPSGGTIVWEWHVWDHLIQDYSSSKWNYGDVEAHPELLDLNYLGSNPSYVDWLHINSIDYNSEFNQIIFSSRYLSEIYIIDHSTTTAEAAAHNGGNYGKGGDILYRWGNPEVYRRGSVSDKKLFDPHSAKWIGSELPDGNKIIVFNNGVNRPEGNYSSVDIINLPFDSLGIFTLDSGAVYGPDTLDWSYVAPIPTDFYAPRVSGAQRLPNGNTLMTLGPQGVLIEVDYNKQMVWNYINPVNNFGIASQGSVLTGNGCFRTDRYGTDFSGFAGRDLTPGDPVELDPIAYECDLVAQKNIFKNNEYISVFPNPATSKVFFSGISFPVDIKFYSITGQCFYSLKINKEILNNGIDISSLPQGFYTVRLTSESNIFTVKLLKN